MRTLIALATLLALAQGAGTRAHAAEGPAAETRQAILDCTFELLAEMPVLEHDAHAVRVAGTAFCFGDGQLASAAHVLDQALGGRFATPFVRDRRGRVYPVDRIVRYSMADDFVVFTAAGLPALAPRPHNTSGETGDALYLAWRRADGDIAFSRTRYRGRSTVADFGRDGWIRFGPAPGHGASGGALLDASGRVIGLINSRSSERADALAFAAPIALVADASTEWADIRMRDPLRPLGMPSTRNLPLEGGIPLPSAYARFEKHMIDVRRTYFAHTLPYSLALEGDGAPLSDDLRARLCAALSPDYCLGDDDVVVTRTRAEAPLRGCATTWNGVGAAVVRCRTRPGMSPVRLINDTRAQIAAASFARPFTQAPPAPCAHKDPLAASASSETFTDHTGATWQLNAWPVRGCDWTIVSMSRATSDGTLSLVRGAPTAYTEVAAIHLKALTGIRCHTCARAPSQVLAEMHSTSPETTR